MAKKRATKKKAAPAKRAKQPKAQRLPGTSGALPALEKSARAYRALVTERLDLQRDEAKALERVGAELKRTGKRIYRRGKVEVWIQIEKEKVKVKIGGDDGSEDD